MTHTAELIMDLTDQEAKAALLLLAEGMPSMGGQATTDATVTAISRVLERTRGL